MAILAGNLFYRFFKRGNETPFEAKNLEEFVPERLFFGILAGLTGPLFGEADGVVPDFVPRQGHTVS